LISRLVSGPDSIGLMGMSHSRHHLWLQL
jgi:hypothetical protein